MKKIKFLVAFFLLFAVSVVAQQKKYIPYEVKKGETLKKIAKQYNLSSKELSKLNPGVSRKPVMGTLIIVPNKNYAKPISNTTDNKEQIYTVKPKETLYGISKKFGVSMDVLKAANPQLADGVKIGMNLTIPRGITATQKTGDTYVMHTVVKDDTEYNLTKRYNVTQADLLALNPALKEGLKLGMDLKIKPIETGVEGGVVDGEVADQMAMDSIASAAIFEEQLQFNKTINVAFILPYKLNKLTDSLMDQSFAKNNLLNITTDFHMGAKIAIDSLKAKGLKINVKYFDSESSNQKLQLIANQNNNFNTTDFVIGPLFFDKAHWLSKHIKTPVIEPIYSKKQEGVNQRNLIKTIPNSSINQQKLVTYLEANYNGENVIIVNDGKAETQTQLWQIVNKIKTFDSIQKVDVVKPEKGYINRAIFSKKIDTLANTWVLIVSDDKVTSSATVNGLKGFPSETKIDLFALNKGKNFDNIDNLFLGKLNFTYPTSEFINTSNEALNDFYSAFYNQYKAYPSKYALRGFDVAYDVLVRYASADKLDDGLTEGKSNRLSSVFQYSKNAFGSIENNGLFIIRYNEDLTTTIIE